MMKPTYASRRATDDEFSIPYHRHLVAQVEGDCVLHVLEQQQSWLCELACNLSVEQLDRVHSPFAWTLRQVFEHCANAERAFGYRMMRFAAGDETNCHAWDENAYAEARFGLGNFSALVSELGALRQANICLLRRIVPAAWDRRGTVNNNSITVRAIAWVTAAHLQHHLRIVEQRSAMSEATR